MVIPPEANVGMYETMHPTWGSCSLPQMRAATQLRPPHCCALMGAAAAASGAELTESCSSGSSSSAEGTPRDGSGFGGGGSASSSCDVPDLTWTVPRHRPLCAPGEPDACGPALAGRDFEPSEPVERSFCVPLGSGDVQGVLQRLCFHRPGQPPDADLWLLPLGWGLLLGRAHGAEANLRVEYEFSPPCGQARPPAWSGGGVAAVHWLVFRAARRITAGEPMRVQVQAPALPSAFAAARAASGVAGIPVAQPSEEEEIAGLVLRDAPAELGRPHKPVATLGASPVHGVGVFAARDICAGETVELVPMLPLSWAEAAIL